MEVNKSGCQNIGSSDISSPGMLVKTRFWCPMIGNRGSRLVMEIKRRCVHY
jgi:hypothetical protein